ncbi:MAG: DUF4010 domain-containing protein, partial [Nitrospirota bacterium]
PEPVSLRNPFELGSALKFGLFFAVVIFAAKAAHVFLGEKGLYASSVVAGSTDVDAILLSVVQFHKEGLLTATAVTAITLGAITNTVVKAGIAGWLGGRSLGLRVIAGLGAALGAGALTLFMVG